METYVLYIGKSALAAAAFYLLYLALFQHQKHFTFNRIYLPVSLALSFLIPLITFTSIRYLDAAPVSYDGFAYLAESTTVVESTAFQWQWYHYLISIYSIGSLGFLLYLVLGHVRAISIIRKSRLQKLFNVNVNITFRDVHPFSFFSKIILSEKTLLNPNLPMIVQHEAIHVRGKHTLDILFAEILFLFQWFNPFAWLLKDAIKNNLEYLTDDELTQTNDAQQYQLAMVGLAHKQGVAPFLTALNGSQLKNRIIMMKKKTENKYALLKQLVVLPLLAVLVMGLSNREVKTEIVPAKAEMDVVESGNTIPTDYPELKFTGDLFDGTFKIRNTKGEFVKPMYIVNGEKRENLDNVDRHDIASMSLLNDDLATKYYGSKGKNGVVQIGTMDWKFPNSEEPLIILDGEVYNGKIEDIPQKNLFHVRELRYPSDSEEYGEKGKNGVVEISTTKKQMASFYSKKSEIPDGLFGSLFGDKSDLNNLQVQTKQNTSGTISERNTKEFTISGTITDQNGNPISGAAIIVKGKTVGTITDMQGDYELKLDNRNETLVFMMVGFDKKEVNVDSQNHINAQLNKEEQPKSGEIKVTGYANRKEYKYKVSGKVTNETGNPIPGTAVLIKGKTVGTITDMNGHYEIGYNDPIETLVYSMVGKQTVERKVGTEKEINVQLKAEAGETKGEIQIRPADNGKAAGSSTGVLIRNTINQTNEPLYVVDGNIVANIDYINPEYIESVNVLKVESATKLYGDKGKNGVIMVTTKKVEPKIAIRNKSGKDEPLYVVDGKVVDNVDNVDPNHILLMNVLNGEAANIAYGEKGKNGVVEITTKSKGIEGKPLIILDGEKTDTDINGIDPETIASISVFKDAESIKKYGAEGKDGVIVIRTKEYKVSSVLELRKYIATKIKYPMVAVDNNTQGTVKLYVKFNPDGSVANILKENKAGADVVNLDEVVVVAYGKNGKSNSSDKNDSFNALEREAERIVETFPSVDIPEFKGKTVRVNIKFVLQKPEK